MSLYLVLIIALPLLGAGGTLGLSCISRARPYTRYVALVAVGLTTVLNLILLFGWVQPAVVIPSLWKPSLLFRGALALRSDAMVQPLALVLTLALCGPIFVDLSRAERPRPQMTAALSAVLSAGLVTLWSANLLTLLVTWTVYDLLQAVGQTAAGSSARAAVRSLVLGSLATLLLWGGALLSGGEGSGELWSLMAPSRTQLVLWAAAGLLRLWVYPFHLLAAHGLDAAPPLAASLHLSPILGWGLWLRLVSLDGTFLSDSPWVLMVAAFSLALGGFLAWSCKDPRHILRWIGMSVTGAGLLSAGLAGEDAAVVITGVSVNWALGIALLFLQEGTGERPQTGDSLWAIPSGVGALALLGIPLTSGFITQATLLSGIVKGDRLGWEGAFFIGNLFLVPSLARYLLSIRTNDNRDRVSEDGTPADLRALLQTNDREAIPMARQRSSRGAIPMARWLPVARGVGLGLLALPLIVVGVAPALLVADGSDLSLGALFAMPGLGGWLLWSLSLIGGGILAWQENVLRPKVELWLGTMHDLLRLEWLYDTAIGALNRGLDVMRAADEMVGGAGALLWSLLLFLLLVLMWGS